MNAELLRLRNEIEAFKTRWKPLEAADSFPCITWAEIERQLVDLAPSEAQAELVHGLLARAKVLADLRPPEMLLRELFCIAALTLQEPTPALSDG